MSYNSQSYSLKKKEIINFNFRFVVDIYTVLSYTLTPNFCHINLFLFSDAWYCNYLFSEIDIKLSLDTHFIPFKSDTYLRSGSSHF